MNSKCITTINMKKRQITIRHEGTGTSVTFFDDGKRETRIKKTNEVLKEAGLCMI